MIILYEDFGINFTYCFLQPDSFLEFVSATDCSKYTYYVDCVGGVPDDPYQERKNYR